MYQQPTMTRPAYRPEPDRPQRLRFQLAGRRVTQEMFYAAEQGKRAAGRVFFFTLTACGDETGVPPTVCENCLGAEYLGLDVATAGPLREIPTPTDSARAAWHAGAWWLVARNLYACPVCNPVREINL